jgi:hypothetical protein
MERCVKRLREVKGKRSIRQDEQILAKLKARLSADTPITEITAQRIAQYERDRVVEKSKLGRLVTPSTVNRELAILRQPAAPRGGMGLHRQGAQDPAGPGAGGAPPVPGRGRDPAPFGSL